MPDLSVQQQQYHALTFWNEVAKLHDTYGLPYDIIRMRLRHAGLKVDDVRFLRLVAYLVGRRNKRTELIPWDEFVRDYLILLPEGWSDWEVVTDA